MHSCGGIFFFNHEIFEEQHCWILFKKEIFSSNNDCNYMHVVHLIDR